MAAPRAKSDFPPGVATPAQRALASIGVSCVADLARHTRNEIRDLHGMGPKALAALDRALETRGLGFKD